MLRTPESQGTERGNVVSTRVGRMNPKPKGNTSLAATHKGDTETGTVPEPF